MHITGEKGGRPVKVGVAVTDILTGHHAQSGILAALLKRGRTGKGGRVECSLFETQVRLIALRDQRSAHKRPDCLARQYWGQLPDRRARGDSMGHFPSFHRSLPSLPDQRQLHHALCRQRHAVRHLVLASGAEQARMAERSPVQQQRSARGEQGGVHRHDRGCAGAGGDEGVV